MPGLHGSARMEDNWNASYLLLVRKNGVLMYGAWYCAMKHRCPCPSPAWAWDTVCMGWRGGGGGESDAVLVRV